MEKSEKTIVSSARIGIFYKRQKKKKQSQPIVQFKHGTIEEDELLTHFDRNILVLKLNLNPEQIEWYNKYFNYELSQELLTTPNVDYVVLFTDDYYSMNEKIKKYGLTEISDFIFFIIYNIQIRQAESFINDHKDLEESLGTVDEQIKMLIDLFKMLGIDSRDETPNQIEKSTYKIKGSRKHLELNNPSFIYDMFSMYATHLRQGSMLNDSEKHLNAMGREVKARIKSDITLTNRIALALHLFFTENTFFKIRAKNSTTNNELVFISDILSLANLYPKKRDKGDAERMKVTRLIMDQIALPPEQRIKGFNFRDIDLSILEKYFSKEILKLGNENKSKYVGYAAMGICNRFNIHIKERAWEIAHMIECIDIHLKRIGSDLELATEKFEGLKVFKDFIENVFSGQLKSISYETSISNHPGVIKQEQPVNMIAHAIYSYFNHYRLNLNVDIVHIKNGQYYFTEVQEQFLPYISLNLYRYAEENLNLNDERYTQKEITFQFIARVLMETDLFKQVDYAEPEVLELIGFWLRSLTRLANLKY